MDMAGFAVAWEARLFPRWCSENHSPVGESGAMTRSQKMGFGNLLVELVRRISGIRRLAVKKKKKRQWAYWV